MDTTIPVINVIGNHHNTASEKTKFKEIIERIKHAI
jgi:hypothetical protein